LARKEIILLPTGERKYEEYTMHMVPAKDHYQSLELEEDFEVYIPEERMSFYGMNLPNPGVQTIKFFDTFTDSRLFIQDPDGKIIGKYELHGESESTLEFKTAKKGFHYFGFLNLGEGEESNALVVIGAEDTTPPPEVEGAFLTAGDGQLAIEWTNPVDVDGDFAGILLINIADGRTIDKLNPSTTSYDWTGLNNGQTYRVKIATFDTNDNQSEGINLKGVPSGTGSPAMVVSHGGSNISNGGLIKDNSVNNIGGVVNFSLEIENRGSAPLILAQDPVIQGDSDFAMVSPPTQGASIAGGGSASFTIQFTAADVRRRQATLVLATNDVNQPEDPNNPGEYLYEIDFQAWGPGIWPVDPSGDDKGPGTIANPFATLETAVKDALEDKQYSSKAIRLTTERFNIPQAIVINNDISIQGGFNASFQSPGAGNTELIAVSDNNMIFDIRNRSKDPVVIEDLDLYTTSSKQNAEIGLSVQGKANITNNRFFANGASTLIGVQINSLDGDGINLTGNQFNMPLDEGGADYAYGILAVEGAGGVITLDSNSFGGALTKNTFAGIRYQPSNNTLTSLSANTINMANAPYSYGFLGGAKEITFTNNTLVGYPNMGDTIGILSKAILFNSNSGLVQLLDNTIDLGTVAEGSNFGVDLTAGVEKLLVKGNSFFTVDEQRSNTLFQLGPETPWVLIVGNRFQLMSTKLSSIGLLDRSAAGYDTHQIYSNLFIKDDLGEGEGTNRFIQLEKAQAKVFHNSFFSEDTEPIEYIAAFDSPAMIANNVFLGQRREETAIYQDERSKSPISILEHNAFYNVQRIFSIGTEVSLDEGQVAELESISGSLYPEGMRNNQRNEPVWDLDITPGNPRPLLPLSSSLTGANEEYQTNTPEAFESYEGISGGDYLGAYKR
jgi:hypothetical protein